VAPNIIANEEDHIEETPTAELLCPHYCFGHVSFKKLQEMAKQKMPPKISVR